MKGLAQIGTLGNTPIRVHWSTALLPVGVVAYALYAEVGLRGLLWLELFVVATLTCVLLHELGHAIAARYFCVPVHDIVLLPIGGAARLERLPNFAHQEAVVALAGPAVNLLIALVLLPSLFIWPQHEWYPWLDNYTWRSGIVCLAIFNGLVCIFNLLPLFPLDGGRLLRATLTNWMTRLQATRITAGIARLTCLAALAYAVYESSFYIGAFAVYGFLVAGREIHGAKIQTFLDLKRVGEIALPLRVFEPRTLVGDLLHQLHRNDQRGAVVADECSPIGFVTQAMLSGLAAERPVGDVEMLAVVCHDGDTPLRALSRQFSEHPRSVAIEEIDSRPAGYIDLELLDEAFQAFAKTA